MLLGENTITNLTIEVDVKSAEKEILKLIAEHLGEMFIHTRLKITDLIRLKVVKAISESPTIQDLLNGDLRGELGIIHPPPRILEILQIWSEGIYYEAKTPKVSGKTIKGGFFIGMIDDDWEDVLNADGATYEAENGSIIRWLDWLLLEGRRKIVRGYQVEFGPFGRTKIAHMVVTDRASESWGIPPEHAGTTNNNFVTRALEEANLEEVILGIIQEEFENYGS